MASQRLGKYLRVEANSTQIDRVTKTYGGELEELSEDLQEDSNQEIKDRITELEDDEKAYIMMDGSMVLTREKSEWKEIKLARIFHSGQHYELNANRKWIKESLYVSHFGSSEDFISKLEPVSDEYDKLGDRLVFVNDGAKWIWKWVEESYPSSIQVLDYYHAAEYLGDFARAAFRDKNKRTDWVSQQKLLLLNDGVNKVIANVKAIECRSVKRKEAKNKLLTYYENNKERMKYKTYKERGILIGSGPIESAHRTVIQKRLKQSGQRWTIKGAQFVANLRVANMSGLWNKVVDLIKNAA